MRFVSFFRKCVVLGVASVVSGIPLVAAAHEVYVLDTAEVVENIAKGPLDIFSAATAHQGQFVLWASIGFFVFVAVLAISLSRAFGKMMHPLLLKIKPYAEHLIQITLGVGLIASAHHNALFGPELPLEVLFGSSALFARIALYITGACILFGVYTRAAAVVVVALFAATVAGKGGSYMLGYATYFGIATVLAVFGGAYAIVQYKPRLSGTMAKILFALHKRKFFILRMFFASSLMYAALYAKLLHGSLALTTVLKYNLTDYFPFDPLFVVLGAFLIEITVGLFYLFGFEIRFTSLLFLTFLTLSMCFFGEAVWPHYVLIGTAFAMIAHGYDEYTVGRGLTRKRKNEPVF